jgi:putative ABC transport system permease protein
VDAAVFTFSLAVAALTGVLFGVIPAFASASVDVRDALQGAGRGATGRGRSVRRALVGSEVALAVTLLVVVTMLAKSFAHVQAVRPGFDPDGVLTARLSLPPGRYATREAIVGFQRALADRLSSSPAVTHAAAVSLLPLSGSLLRVPFTVDGRPIERERVPLAQYRLVSPGYFAAAGIPLKRGRAFSERDSARTLPVAVVSEALARRWLEGLEPIGARLRVDDNDGSPRTVEIVGVVGSVRQVAIDAEPTWDLYLPYAQLHPDNVGLAAGNMFWVVRTPGDPASLAGAFAREVRQLDPEVAAAQAWPMDRYLADARAPRRFSLSLLAAFALAAVALALTGLYALVLSLAGERARELAIRSALGAPRSDLVLLVMRDGVMPALPGVALGLGAAFAITTTLSSLFFGLRPVEPIAFALSPLALLLVSAAACVGPGVRAARAAITGNVTRAS